MELQVRLSGSSSPAQTVRWFKGSSTASVRSAVAAALGLPPGTNVVLRESEGGAVVALSDSLPAGLSLVVEAFDTLPTVSTDSALANGYGGSSSSSSSSKQSRLASGDTALDSGTSSAAKGVAAAAAAAAESFTKPVTEWTARVAQNLNAQRARNARNLEFRGQVLRLERVQAHLANERTWLAWARTSLSALSVAFSLLTLADEASVSWLAISLFVCGCLMVLNVALTFGTGWVRYVVLKDILLLSTNEMTQDFGRFGITHHARFLALILIAVSVLYIAGAKDIT